MTVDRQKIQKLSNYEYIYVYFYLTKIFVNM